MVSKTQSFLSALQVDGLREKQNVEKKKEECLYIYIYITYDKKVKPSLKLNPEKPAVLTMQDNVMIRVLLTWGCRQAGKDRQLVSTAQPHHLPCYM